MTLEHIQVAESWHPHQGRSDIDAYVVVEDTTRSQCIARTEAVQYDDEGGVVRISGYVYSPGTMRDFGIELPGIKGIPTLEIGALVAAALLDYTTRQLDAGLGYGNHGA